MTTEIKFGYEYSVRDIVGSIRTISNEYLESLPEDKVPSTHVFLEKLSAKYRNSIAISYQQKYELSPFVITLKRGGESLRFTSYFSYFKTPSGRYITKLNCEHADALGRVFKFEMTAEYLRDVSVVDKVSYSFNFGEFDIAINSRVDIEREKKNSVINFIREELKGEFLPFNEVMILYGLDDKIRDVDSNEDIEKFVKFKIKEVERDYKFLPDQKVLFTDVDIIPKHRLDKLLDYKKANGLTLKYLGDMYVEDDDVNYAVYGQNLFQNICCAALIDREKLCFTPSQIDNAALNDALNNARYINFEINKFFKEK